VSPQNLKELFSYDEKRLLKLFDDYGLLKLNTHLENLNRFLAFIGLRFSIPEQSLDFLDQPPAYPSSNVLESSKEKSPNILSSSPPDLGVGKPEVEPEVEQEHKQPPQEPMPTVNNPAEVRAQVKRLDERTEEKYEGQQDHSGQRSTGIETSTFGRQSPTVATNTWGQHDRSGQRPTGTEASTFGRLSPTVTTNNWGQQYHSPTHTTRPVNRNLPPQPGPQEDNSVAGWIKSFTGSR